MGNNIAKKWHISSLYHITPTANMDSIRQHGLLSISEMRQRGIETVEYASTADSRSGDEYYLESGYIYLCLHPGLNMFYTVVEEERCGPLTLLEISLDVLTHPNSVFSDRPSNLFRTEQFTPVRQKLMKKDDPSDMHFHLMSTDREYIRFAEVLIPSHIDPTLIVSEAKWQRDLYSYHAENLHSGRQET